jgi:hypothetical protein
MRDHAVGETVAEMGAHNYGTQQGRTWSGWSSREAKPMSRPMFVKLMQQQHPVGWGLYTALQEQYQRDRAAA